MSLGAAELLKRSKENSWKSLTQSKGATTLLALGKKSKRSKSSAPGLPFCAVGNDDPTY